ncbi:ferredoxin reductase family protein [Alginatibacterium sediminis]|nr:ferredoxin reductase family protein [Alginatibacterium sediminis]
MSPSAMIKSWQKNQYFEASSSRFKLSTAYTLLLPLPFIATLFLSLDFNGYYFAAISFMNLLAMMAFYLQFPLAGRIKNIPLFANIDWSMTQHKQVGKALALVFLLHPILILAPRFMASTDDGLTSLRAIVTSPNTLSGIVAYLLMLVWITLSIFKDKLRIRYETWRVLHVVGFMLIAILATSHITSIGSHSQFNSRFEWLWWSLCALSLLGTAYNYFIKPAKLKHRPFTLESVERVSSRDWQLTLTAPENANFSFEAGQFVWLSTSDNRFGLQDHPFSIASSATQLPSLSFIIRELGDYTSTLDQLLTGQEVYVDGPYGSLDLNASNQAKGITLIAGGAGIAPMLSLLRALADKADPRPIRLIYAAKNSTQLVMQNEINDFELTMPNFKQQRVCEELLNEELSSGDSTKQGFVDIDIIRSTIAPQQLRDWAVYVCGPEPMMEPVGKALTALQIRKSNIHFEQLSF